MASGYALNKADNSLPDDTQYADWFKVKIGLRHVDVVSAWASLPADLRSTISTRLPDVRLTDDDDIVFEHGRGNPAGSLKSWNAEYLPRAGRNPLKAAVDIWLSSGVLFGQEERFIEVLRLAGVEVSRFEHPNAEFPAVLPAFLRIQAPLDTTDIPEAVVQRLLQRCYSARDRSDTPDVDWDKRFINHRQWAERLLEDQRDDTTLAWSVIPDRCTSVLESLGYDGIRDHGGKYHPREHAVWVPFYPAQVKSAVGNSGLWLREGDMVDRLKTPSIRQRPANLTSTFGMR